MSFSFKPAKVKARKSIISQTIQSVYCIFKLCHNVTTLLILQNQDSECLPLMHKRYNTVLLPIQVKKEVKILKGGKHLQIFLLISSGRLTNPTGLFYCVVIVFCKQENNGI